MAAERVSRRNFAKLTTAAFGGMALGAACAENGGQPAADAANDEPGSAPRNGDRPEILVDPALLLQEPNVCRGLNMCEGKGQGDHACAGMCSCATAGPHSCRGENDCKGTGGCGAYPGQNVCAEKGHCAVPLKDEVWEIARKQFEHLHADMGKEVGDPPAA